MSWHQRAMRLASWGAVHSAMADTTIPMLSNRFAMPWIYKSRGLGYQGFRSPLDGSKPALKWGPAVPHLWIAVSSFSSFFAA